MSSKQRLFVLQIHPLRPCQALLDAGSRVPREHFPQQRRNLEVGNNAPDVLSHFRAEYYTCSHIPSSRLARLARAAVVNSKISLFII